MKMNLMRFKVEKNRNKLKKMIRKVNETKMHNKYIQLLHENAQKMSLWKQYRKVQMEEVLPLSCKFYKDGPKLNKSKNINV